MISASDNLAAGRRTILLALLALGGMMALACATPAYVAPKPEDTLHGIAGESRADCAAIYGSAYHSPEERQWFAENCSKWPPTKFGDVVVNRAPEPAACAGIRGRPYQNDDQRRWFLANCNGAGQATSAPGAPGAAPPVVDGGTGPDRTDCNAIRGSTYRSNNERNWFLTNCPAAQPNPAAPPPPPGAANPAPAQGPDRFDCNAVRGTPYRSNAERAWYQQNCRAPDGGTP